MLGAIAGDVIGAPWESSGEKRYNFPLFTEYSRFSDDTVMTVAVATALLERRDYACAMRALGRRYPFAGYGRHFQDWLLDEAIGPYDSYGNGGAMRASPIGFAARSVEEALAEAGRCAAPTHGHPEGVEGAQAVALAVFLARSGASKSDLGREIAARFGYNLDRTVESIRPSYTFDVAAVRSVPEAIVCFLDAENFEDAVRNAVSLGGDADTMACIAGAIAEAYWGEVPAAIANEVRSRLPVEFVEVLERFTARYPGRADVTPSQPGWRELREALRRHVLPLYLEHERTFDAPGIHGRMHVCRCLLFGEFMCRYYLQHTMLRPALNDVRYAIAFHDAGRRENGPDLWGHESAALCAAHARRNAGRFSRSPEEMAALVADKGSPGAAVEARIVHDADVLDIMRPCCGHGGREGFWEGKLCFLGPRDAVPDAATRSRLIEEAWALIRATEQRKRDLRDSADYLAAVIAILSAHRKNWPMLATTLLE